jgi:hypothetical protein
MSYAIAGRFAVYVVISIISGAAGHTYSNARSKRAHEAATKKMNEENERERAEAMAFLAAIIANNANMEAAMASIVANKPNSRADVITRLRAHGLTEVQIANIMTQLDVLCSCKEA